MKCKYIIILLSLTCIFDCISQAKIDSIFKDNAVRIDFVLARTESWTPYRDNYQNIIDLKTINESTTLVSYLIRKHMDSGIEQIWSKVFVNESIYEFFVN